MGMVSRNEYAREEKCENYVAKTSQAFHVHLVVSPSPNVLGSVRVYVNALSLLSTMQPRPDVLCPILPCIRTLSVLLGSNASRMSDGENKASKVTTLIDAAISSEPIVYTPLLFAFTYLVAQPRACILLTVPFSEHALSVHRVFLPLAGICRTIRPCICSVSVPTPVLPPANVL